MKVTINDAWLTGLTSIRDAKARLSAYKALYAVQDVVVYVRGIFVDTKGEFAFLQHGWYEVESWIGATSFFAQVDGQRTALRLQSGDKFDLIIGQPAGKR